MLESPLQTLIRETTQPLYDRVAVLEKKLQDLQLLCEACQQSAWKDPECSALFTAFVTKMDAVLKRK